MEDRRLVIIGAGPAGCAAAIYAARAMLEPLVFTGFSSGPSGGQLMTTTDVENFPGFPEGISGPALMEKMKAQAERFGAKFLTEDVESVQNTSSPFRIQGSSTVCTARAVLMATGASAKRLDIPGTRDGEFWQKGVSACAVCDGALPLFRNKDLYVIGGGDSAMEEALYLTRYASRVFIVHRREALRASKIMASRALHHPKITVLWNSVVHAVEGDSVVRTVTIRDVRTSALEIRPAAGVFFAVGHEPNSTPVRGLVECDSLGYIVVRPGTCQTSVLGIYAAGDVQDRIYRQAVTAAGSGCMAALEIERAIG